jgi:hypothetical protein
MYIKKRTMRYDVLGKLAAISEREREEMTQMSEGVSGVCGCVAERGKGPVPEYVE